jgi:predicted HTH transcriptional regulator
MDDATQISTHLLRGGLFENMVINEFIKRSLHQGQERRIAMSSTTETVTLPLRLERSSPGNEDITVTDNLTENQQRIIKLITENNRVSTTQMADNIGISKRKVLDNISKLKKMGLIRRIGTPKAGHWKIINK